MKRRTKLDTRAIVMLAFGLIAVIAIMVQMRNAVPKPPPAIAQLNGQRIGIVDSVYINLPFRFMIKRPHSHWRFTMLSRDSAITPFDPEHKIFDQIAWLVSGTRLAEGDSLIVTDQPTQMSELNTTGDAALAEMQIGVLSNTPHTSSKEVTISLLAERIAYLESDGGRVRILQSVTSPAHQTLKGNYCAVIAPDEHEIDKPVVVYAVLPRGELLYLLSFQTNELVYPTLKGEIEEFVQRFHPLPSTIK